MKNAPKGDELQWRAKYQGLWMNDGDRDRLIVYCKALLNCGIDINKNAAPYSKGRHFFSAGLPGFELQLARRKTGFGAPGSRFHLYRRCSTDMITGSNGTFQR